MNAGAATVEWLRREQLQVDDDWSEATPQGFRWWAEHYAQTIEAVGGEPAADGTVSYSVTIRTDFVHGVELDERAVTVVNTLIGPTASMAGVVYFPNLKSLQLCSSVRVNDHNLLWSSRLVNMAATLQLSEAAEMAGEIAKLVRGEPARSGHPVSGHRQQPDQTREMTALLIAPMGREASRWTSIEFERAIAELVSRPFAPRAIRSGCGIATTIPFGGEVSRLELINDAAHPRYGNGLTCRQSFPFEGPRSLGANMALALNAIELTERAYGYGFGSYVYRDGEIQFVSFYPNLLHRPGLLPHVLDAGVARARELSLRLTGRAWSAESTAPRSKFRRLIDRVRKRPRADS